MAAVLRFLTRTLLLDRSGMLLSVLAVENVTVARSALPARSLAQVQNVQGSEDVYPVVGVPVIFAHGNKKTPIYIIGYDKA